MKSNTDLSTHKHVCGRKNVNVISMAVLGRLGVPDLRRPD